MINTSRICNRKNKEVESVHKFDARPSKKLSIGGVGELVELLVEAAAQPYPSK